MNCYIRPKMPRYRMHEFYGLIGYFETGIEYASKRNEMVQKRIQCSIPKQKMMPNHHVIQINYSRTSVARTLMARLPRLFRTLY